MLPESRVYPPDIKTCTPGRARRRSVGRSQNMGQTESCSRRAGLVDQTRNALSESCRRSNDQDLGLKQPALPRLGATLMRRSFQQLKAVSFQTGAADVRDKTVRSTAQAWMPTGASGKMSSAENATAQVRTAERRRRRASRHVSTGSTAVPALVVAEQKQAEINLQRTVRQAHDALDLVVKSLEIASLRRMPWLITRLLDLKLRSLAPPMRAAIGDMLQRVRRCGGWQLAGGWRINVELNDHKNRFLWTADEPGDGQPRGWHLWSQGLTKQEQEAAQDMVQVLSLRVYSKGSAPTMKDFGETFRNASDSSGDVGDESDSDDAEQDVIDGGHVHKPTADLSALSKLDPVKTLPAGRAVYVPSEFVPKEWEDERHLVVRVDLDVDVALQVNWSRFDIFFALQRPCCGCTDTSLARLGVLAIALRTRVCVWWHVKRNQAMLALIDHENELHFRSFAEVSVGCFKPRPDHLGVASRAVRALLKKITPEQPLAIEFPHGPGSKCQVRWGGKVILTF